MTLKIVTIGGLRTDYLITHTDQVHLGIPGGNALFSAVGATFWVKDVYLLARYGQNFPQRWLTKLNNLGIKTDGLVPVPGNQDHRTFFAYSADGKRDDMNPEKHFARIGHPLPHELRDYVHSTPMQDDPHIYEPLAIRPSDWSEDFTDVTAVHLSPLPLATHLNVPIYLRKQGVQFITLDPGERYMIPERASFIQEILPVIDVFLPSDMEIRSLFGADCELWDAAQKLCDWGARIVVIKIGEKGVLMQEKKTGRRAHFHPYHAPGDPRVIDVTGAGDAFCGGFIAGLSTTNNPHRAAKMGLISASFIIEKYGALSALTFDDQNAQERLAGMG